MGISIYELLVKVNIVPDEDKKSEAKKTGTKAADKGNCCGEDNTAMKETIEELHNVLDAGTIPGHRTSKR